ncbi:AraC family transcriptional regulator [Pantoea rwandensis]|nr:AraC family transcriptional regulator [Pantoea rwandensis]
MSAPQNSLQSSKSVNTYRTVPGLIYICRLIGKDSSVPRVLHKHTDRVEVVFIVKGGGKYLIGDKHYNANPGDVLIFNNNVVHDEITHTSDNSLIYSIGIDSQTWGKTLLKYEVITDFPPHIKCSDNFNLLVEYFNLLWNSESVDYMNSHAAFTELIELLALSSRDASYSNASDVNNVFGEKILNYIEENFQNEIFLEDIADEFDANLFYIIHEFKKFTGYPPKKYIILRRIGEAQSLLVSTKKSITEIANSVGYSNISNFNRIFKKVTGMAPSSYQNYLKKCIISRSGLFENH